MSPQAQRMEIAVACGWNPTADGMWTRNVNGVPTPHNPSSGIPEYLKDLNAMHEAEKVLIDFNAVPLSKNKHAYLDWLCELSGGMAHCPFATAAQRAEAFLRTIGKWEGQR